MLETISTDTLKLIVLDAMFGNIPDSLALFSVGSEGKEVKILGYFKSMPSEEELDNFSCIGTEIISNLDETYTANEQWELLKGRRYKDLNYFEIHAFARAQGDALCSVR